MNIVPGIVEVKGLVFTIDRDGWHCDDKKFEKLMNEGWPIVGTEVGAPFVNTFWEAVEQLRGRVIQEPDAYPESEEGEDDGTG